MIIICVCSFLYLRKHFMSMILFQAQEKRIEEEFNLSFPKTGWPPDEFRRPGTIGRSMVFSVS